MCQVKAPFQVRGCLQVFGDQGRVVIFSILSLFDRRGQASMEHRTIGLELGLVGDGANQRVAERVFGVRGEFHLVDELALDQR